MSVLHISHPACQCCILISPQNTYIQKMVYRTIAMSGRKNNKVVPGGGSRRAELTPDWNCCH